MKKLKQQITDVWFRIWNIRKILKFNRINKRLGKGVSDQEVDRMILKFQIKKYMRKYFKVDAKSKYIPRDVKSDEESRQQVIGRFGEEMERVGLTINDKLELCTVKKRRFKAMSA